MRGLAARCSRRELGLLAASLVVLRHGVVAAQGPTLAELLAHCDGSVVGQSRSPSSDWVELGGKRRIVTVHRFEVERALDGRAAAGDVLSVRALGGRVGDYAQRVSGEAELRVGEPTMLMLTRAEPGLYVVTGMDYGRFPLQRGADGVVRVGARTAHEASTSAMSALAGATLDQAEQILAAAQPDAAQGTLHAR